MLPVDVVLDPEEAEPMPAKDQESRFFSCHVCGDNWFSLKETDQSGCCHITYIHQMGVAPLLKRVVSIDTSIGADDINVDLWDYYLGETQVPVNQWLAQLDERRRTLKSICSN
jgi:hypothetical protein